MKSDSDLTKESKEPSFLLAIHSSTEDLGIAVLEASDPKRSLKISTSKLGRGMSNCLITSVEKLLPSINWHQIKRLAVATGPGGYTGTRLSIVMARTIAQQNNCPLDGISSFALMAPRLSKQLQPKGIRDPFWIIKELNRGGFIAGKYKINAKNKVQEFQEIIEIKKPHFLQKIYENELFLESNEDIYEDISKLIYLSLNSYINKEQSCWSKVLPIYPISPVGNIQ